MLIVMIIITIILLFLSIVLDEYGDSLITTFVFAGLIIEIIALICCISSLIGCRVIDKQIELYETQNKEIEEKVELVVKEYMDYEGKTITEFKSESYITLINLYPDLKADDMIQQQINLYMNNNSTITHLKEKRIKKTIYKWWIYFGK